MALSELQLQIKANFYAKLQDAANKLDKVMDEYRRIAEFIGNINAADLDAMEVSDTDTTRADMVAFRTAIDEILSLWDGNAVAEPSIAPSAAIDKIRWIY